jgi:hypothetical protein
MAKELHAQSLSVRAGMNTTLRPDELCQWAAETWLADSQISTSYHYQRALRTARPFLSRTTVAVTVSKAYCLRLTGRLSGASYSLRNYAYIRDGALSRSLECLKNTIFAYGKAKQQLFLRECAVVLLLRTKVVVSMSPSTTLAYHRPPAPTARL